MPHGLHIDHNDNIWLTDVALHQVFLSTSYNCIIIMCSITSDISNQLHTLLYMCITSDTSFNFKNI